MSSKAAEVTEEKPARFSFRQYVILEKEAVPIIPKTASYLYPDVQLKH